MRYTSTYVYQITGVIGCIEGEREQAEICSVQSCVVRKSRILVLHKTHTGTMSSLCVPALNSLILTPGSSNAKLVSLWSADCACEAPRQRHELDRLLYASQAYLLPLALGVA